MTATALQVESTEIATAANIRLAGTIIERDSEGRVACRCSATCPGATWNIFSQGHDARLVSRLADLVIEQKLTAGQARHAVRLAGGELELELKLTEVIAKALDRWTKRQEAKARREAAKAAKQDATVAPKPVTVTAKVGRWTYEGTVSRDKVSGRAVFTYQNRSGAVKETKVFARI